MAKKFVSVTLDLDEETLAILKRAAAKQGTAVSQVAQELISKTLHELMPSREDVMSAVVEAVRALPDKGYLLDQLLALTEKATRGKPEPYYDAGNTVLLVMQAGAKVFGSDQGFLEWLSYPVPALDDITPLSLLSSSAGLQEIIDLLGTIEHRVSS